MNAPTEERLAREFYAWWLPAYMASDARPSWDRLAPELQEGVAEIMRRAAADMMELLADSRGGDDGYG